MKKSILVLVFLLSIGLLCSSVATCRFMRNSNNIVRWRKKHKPYGFGNSASSISSPGPTLTFTSGEAVTVTLHNAGTMPHNFAIVETKSSTGTVLWNAQIASASNGVAAGSTGSVTFTVGTAGNYYYICQVDGHVAFGNVGQCGCQCSCSRISHNVSYRLLRSCSHSFSGIPWSTKN